MNGIHVAFTGRIGSEPELRYTATGKPMLSFRVAVDEHTREEAGKPPPETTWVRAVAWEDLADQLAAQLQKGASVYVEGRLRLDRWSSSDGQERSGLSVSAWLVQPMGQIGRRAPRREPVAAGGVLPAVPGTQP